MNELLSSPLKFALAGIATAAGLAVVLLTFDGWVKHGTDIFLSAVQSGISWCF
ncbi:hypothetical protein [Rhizobium sp. RM]|uniref:hypothetical protein n=1 Tax=Rhizobium/Agrobacterium group TaxID=227290 RepID=UPI0015B5ABF7|nr:hypothetical protein [Rhizobium sp. RM]NWJ26651.1 hypothetical protein [Rhizobium sp. RM]